MKGGGGLLATMARPGEMARQSPNFIPVWRERCCPSWVTGKLPHEMLQLQRRQEKHQKKMVEMEFVIFHRREDVFNMRQTQRSNTIKSLSDRLKQKELDRDAAEIATERVRRAARREVCTAKLPSTWDDNLCYPSSYAKRPPTFGGGGLGLPVLPAIR